MVSYNVDEVFRNLSAINPYNKMMYTCRSGLAQRQWQLELLTGMSEAVVSFHVRIGLIVGLRIVLRPANRPG